MTIAEEWVLKAASGSHIKPQPNHPSSAHEDVMIQFTCAGCGASYSVSDDKAGKTGKCRKCETPFTVPATTPRPDPRDEELDERPRKPARRDEDDEEEDDRPRRKQRRAEEEDEEERPRRKQSRREDADEDRDEPKPARSPLDRALGAARFALLLEFLAALMVVLVIAALTIISSVSVRTMNGSALLWLLITSIPTWAGIAVPVLGVFASGAVAVLARFRLSRASAGSGAGWVQLLAGLVYAVRMILAAVAVVLIGLAMSKVTETPGFGSVVADMRVSLTSVVVLSALALFCAWIAEIFTLSGVALLGWHLRGADEQRKRIGQALALYPLLLLCVSVFVALIYLNDVYHLVRVPELIWGIAAVVIFAVMEVLQFVVVRRAYRFPPVADAVN